MLKNSLFSPLCSAPFFCFSLFFFLFFQRRTSLSFSVSCIRRCCSAPALFFFSFCVLPFIFQPKILLFQPKRFSAPKYFFQPKTFFGSAQFFFFFSQFNHSSLLLFSALFFSGSALFFFSFSASFFSFL